VVKLAKKQLISPTSGSPVRVSNKSEAPPVFLVTVSSGKKLTYPLVPLKPR
jgi:hypothetical protein